MKQTEKGRQSTNLDLRSMKLAFLKLNDAMKRWVMKHSHGTCGVNVWLHRWKQLASPICERCECHDETALHIWKCEKSKEWHSIINSWEGWLRRYNCPEPDIEAYTATWQSWRRNVTSIRLSKEISVPMRIALTDQNKIGWDKMAFGYISIHWSTVLASWRGNKYAPSPQQLIKQIWKAGHKLWDERNGWIHNDTRIKQIKKVSEINEMIQKEYERGGTDLPEEEKRLLRQPILTIIASSRIMKKNWLGRIYAARSRVRRRMGILIGEEVEDSFKNERTILYNWRTSGNGKIETDTEDKNKRKRDRQKGELLLRVEKRRKQILYEKLMKKPKQK